MVFVLGAFHRATASALLILGRAPLAGGNRKGNDRIAGYFCAANISRLVVLVHFAENIFVDHTAMVGFKYNRRLRDRCYNITPTFFREQYPEM